MYFRNRVCISQKGINFNLQHNEYVRSIQAQVKFLCFETEKHMLDSILVTKFLESLMKFTDNLNDTESDNLL